MALSFEIKMAPKILAVATIILSYKSLNPFVLLTSKIKLQLISEKIKLLAWKIFKAISSNFKFTFFLSRILIHSNKTIAGMIIVALAQSQESKITLLLFEKILDYQSNTKEKNEYRQQNTLNSNFFKQGFFGFLNILFSDFNSF